nr:serine/threonine-protein kinase LATS1-like [Nomia melanderi]
MNPPAVSKSSTRGSGYHQKALAEIRNSLLPFANIGGASEVGSSAASTISTLSTTSGISSASGLSGLSGASGSNIDKSDQRQLLAQLLAMGYSEEIALRALKLGGWRLDAAIEFLKQAQGESLNGLSKLNTKLIRKPSLERELNLQRGSPALDSGAGSSRSDSPRLTELSPHPQLSRQYSPSNFVEREPPPPPPPRCSSTPPPPPPPHVPYNQPNVPTNMQQMLKRMSPAPVVPTRPPPTTPGNTGPISTSTSVSLPQRGTSPVASSNNNSNRQPMIVQNGPQVQQQLSQQIQALSIYQTGSNSSSTQVEPPPPYPIVSSSSAGPVQPPSYSVSIQNRQSPTQSQQDYRKSPSSGIYSGPTSAGSPSPITVSAMSPNAQSSMARPTPLQAWGARQAKTQPPIIMQSVKSTQVQKPVLQTAIAPTSPQPISTTSNTPPPPNNNNNNHTTESNGAKGGGGSTPSSYKIKHQSPIPERKHMSKEKEEERRDCKVRNYSPQAFKFFMEQHVENVLKSHKQRLYRRLQLETEMAKIGLSAEAQCQMRKMLSQKESNYIRLKRAKMDKSMFTKIKPIGVGAFGEVTLVRKLDTNQFYAMKTLRKADVLNRNQVAHVKAERDILAEADNEWVVKLYYSFQDKDNLYFVMDYIPGGDLMSLLIKFGIFKEPLARFYIAELTCAVESVHKMGFIHRDIKPDNILIDRDGHIKLTDFGLCTGFRWTHNSKYYQQNGHGKQDSMDPADDWNNECRCIQLKPLERRRHREHQRCLAHSLVGTPNYIAPEVLQRTGYTQLCDWWSVGVILYEMLVGSPPFLANTPAETQYKVINWETTLHIPKQANLSAEGMDLILKLCVGADRRLGKNADEVKSHPFFASIDFDKGLRRQVAPHIPRIQYPTDTSNFDPVDPDKLRNSGSSDSNKSDELLDNGKPFHGFFEFTFRRFFDDGGGPAYPSRISLDDNDNQGPVYV